MRLLVGLRYDNVLRLLYELEAMIDRTMMERLMFLGQLSLDIYISLGAVHQT